MRDIMSCSLNFTLYKNLVSTPTRLKISPHLNTSISLTKIHLPSRSHMWQVPLKHPKPFWPPQLVQYEPSSWHSKLLISLYAALQVSQQQIDISIHSEISILSETQVPLLRFFQQYKTSFQASILTLVMPAALPSSFACHMAVEFPQILSIFPTPLHLVLFCAESFLEQPCRISLKEPGNGTVPVELGTIFSNDGYPCRIVTTSFAEICMELEFVPEEFS